MNRITQGAAAAGSTQWRSVDMEQADED